MKFGVYAGLRVLVTGATGLIGSSLVRSLSDLGANVHIFSIPQPEPQSLLVRSGAIERVVVHRGWLQEAEAVAAAVVAASPQVVFHLGAQTLVGRAREQPVETFRANIGGTWALLEGCRRLAHPPSAVAVASSDKAYGTSDHLPYVETDPLAGEGPYEASKAAADLLARTYGLTYGLPVRIARCGNVYGSGDFNWSRLVPGVISALILGQPPVVRSDGSPVRDYIHVDDVVEAYLTLGALKIAPGEAFNFSSGERLTVLEVVNVVSDAVGVRIPPVILDEARGEIAEQYLDSTKARTQLGWRAARRLRASLPEIVQWYRELLAAPDRIGGRVGRGS